MKSQDVFLGLAAGFAVALIGCSAGARQAQATAAESQPPSVATGKVGPIAQASARTQPRFTPEVDSKLVAKGEKLHQKNCVFCHQEDAVGKPGVAPSLTNKEFLSIASDRFLKATIRDGREGTGMPPFAHLGKNNIDALVAYLRSHAKLPNRAAQVDAQPRAQGDPRLGQQWFEQICATCHGPRGNGYAAGGTGTAIGRAGFLDKASDGFIRTTINEGRSNTRMRGFNGADGLANLSDREVDDVIAYLRSIKH